MTAPAAPDPGSAPGSAQLPPDLTRDEAGHLSEIALAALADGELGLVDPEALLHLDSCDHCSIQLAEAALRSAEVGELLRSRAAGEALSPQGAGLESAEARRPRRLPVRWLALGLAVAAVGVLPRLIEAGTPARWLDLVSLVTEVLPALVLRLVVLLRDPGPVLAPTLTGSSMIVSLVLFAAALAFARAASGGRLAVSKEIESP